MSTFDRSLSPNEKALRYDQLMLDADQRLPGTRLVLNHAHEPLADDPHQNLVHAYDVLLDAFKQRLLAE